MSSGLNHMIRPNNQKKTMCYKKHIAFLLLNKINASRSIDLMNDLEKTKYILESKYHIELFNAISKYLQENAEAFY